MAASSCVVSGAGGDRNRVIGELTRGRDFAAQLRLALRETPAGAHDPRLPALVGKIVDSFTQSISVLGAATADSDEFPEVVHPPPAARKSEGFGDSACKTAKDRRGCHKRKRSAETWTKDSPSWPEDNYAWRKYGQKVILNAKHPRNYFRCTHKYDQGCAATKQVQKIQDEPVLFRAIYHSHHTCRTSSSSSAFHHHHQIMTTPDSSIILSFLQQQPIKQEDKQSSTPSSSPAENTRDPHPPPPPAPACHGDYYFVSTPGAAPELGGFSSGSDHGDVYSSTASPRTMEQMEMPDDILDVGLVDEFLDDI